MNPIAIISGIPIWSNSDGSYSYLSAAAVDGDGIGPSHGDPDYQNATSLRYNGQSLNADLVPWIVVPLGFSKLVLGIVLGCKGIVTNVRNGRSILAVVADEGPSNKLGEFSIYCVNNLGIDPSPTTGGTNDFTFAVMLYPGIPAEINGIKYDLQPYNS